MVGRTRQPVAPEVIRRRWRFAVVLVASLLLAVAQPLTSGLFGEGSFDVFFSLLIGAVLLLYIVKLVKKG